MKICGIICEYNPFHNGHQYLLNEAKRQTNADAIVCIMSGHFVQRGEAAIIDKYTRAKHAVFGGADAVIELPAAYATSNAELFAKGALHILSSIPDCSYLCFGAENANAEKILHAAKLLLNEPGEVSKKIKDSLANGISYAKARANAWQGIIEEDYLSSPNNILAIEYTKALLQKNSSIQLVPITRIGSGYSDTSLSNNFSSASAIRKGIKEGENVSLNLPDFVSNDLPNSLENTLESLEKLIFLNKKPEEIADVCDCSEGLEYAFKRCSEQNIPDFVQELTSTRYTSSRIRRIALQSLLNITKKEILDGLKTSLYLNVLAAKKERADVLSALAKSSFPLLTKYIPPENFSTNARKIYETDLYSDKIFCLAKNLQIKKGNIFY